jgi:hypothetical protein
MERNHWETVLESLPVGSVARFVLALFFIKATNGVSDKVSCPHFKELAETIAHLLSLDIYKEPLVIAAMLRQTSKWVKNTVSVLYIFLFHPFQDLTHLHVSLCSLLLVRSYNTSSSTWMV